MSLSLKPVFCLFLGVAISTLICSPRALAQQAQTGADAAVSATAMPSPHSPAVTLSPQEASHFQQALQAISTRGHLTVVAEDAPLYTRLFGKTDIPLVPTPAPELLAKVAEAYDYDVSRARTVYLLQKRYSDPRDLPAVTPKECLLAMQQIASILTAYDPAMGNVKNLYCGQTVKMFIASLSPAQRQAMQSTNAATGLSMAALSAAQQEMIHQFTGALYLGGASDELQPTLDYLSQSSQITLRVQKSHQAFSQSSTENGQQNSETWSQDAVLGFDASDTPPDTQASDNTVPLIHFHPFNDAPPAPSDPVVVREPRTEPGGGADGYTTLAGVVAGLTAHGSKFAVDAPYQAKPVSVYGVADAVPNDLFGGLASLYGLRVGTDDKDRKMLTAPILLPPDSFDDVPGALNAALPDSLRRAAHDGGLDRKRQAVVEAKQQAYLKAEQEAKTVADVIAAEKMRKDLSPDWSDARNWTVKMHSEAVSRLHEAVDARLSALGTNERTALKQATFTPAIKLSALPASAASEFSITVLTGILNFLNHTVGKKAPQWVADVDNAYLVGGPQPIDNKPDLVSYSLALSYPSENGTLGMTAKAYTEAIHPIVSPSGGQ